MKGKVLMFHRVLPDSEIRTINAYRDRGTLISLSFFESIIKKITLSKKRVLTLIQYHKLQKQLAHNDIVLTFDDGYKDNYDYVLPILEKYNIKGTFYPTLKYCFEGCSSPLDDYYSIGDQLELDMKQRQDWITGKQKKHFLSLNYSEQNAFNQFLSKKHHKNALNNAPYMSISELQKVLSLGHEIGAHSYHHPILPQMNKTELNHELELTAYSLNQLGVPKERTFAYPDGAYSEVVISKLKSEGYLSACTVEEKSISPYQPFKIPRVFVHPNYDITQI